MKWFWLSGQLKRRFGLGLGTKAGPLVLAVLFQATVLLVTAFVVVLAPVSRSEPEFIAGKTIYLPQRELEHRVAMAEFQQAAGPPPMLQKLTTSAMIPETLPGLPNLPEAVFTTLHPFNAPTEAEGLLHQSGLVAALLGQGAEVSTASLFGIEDSGERILIMFDDGGSVLNKARASGMPIERIKEHAISLIESLNANTLFGCVHFVRQVGTFHDYLVPATRENKRLAGQWIERHFGARSKHTTLDLSTNGIQAAFEASFQLQPDVIFLMSDADFQRNVEGKPFGEQVPWVDLENTLEDLRGAVQSEVRIHFIGFQVKEAHRSEIQKIVRRFHGQYRDFH